MLPKLVGWRDFVTNLETIDLPSPYLIRYDKRNKTQKSSMATQEKPLSQSELEDYQNFGQTIAKPTAEELAIADAIIDRAWKLAQASKPDSPEQVWTELEKVRTKILFSK